MTRLISRVRIILLLTVPLKAICSLLSPQKTWHGTRVSITMLFKVNVKVIIAFSDKIFENLMTEMFRNCEGMIFKSL